MKWNKGLLVYNGNAGQKSYENTLGVCVPMLSPHIKQLTLMPTGAPNEAEEICKEYGEEMDVLFILGGDGTVHECINGVAGLKKRPVIGILPGGTCNDFSRELNISQNLRLATAEMLNGVTRLVDIGKVNDRYFLNFWGIGLIAETSNNINSAQKSTLGKVSYFLSALRTINVAEPFIFKMEYDGQLIEDEAILVILFNGKYLGTNQLPFAEINSSDGLLDIIIVKNSSLAVFKEVMINRNYEIPEERTDRDVIYLQAKNVTIETELEKDVDTDGEVYMKTPAEITVLPRHITFLCGNS